MQNQICDRGYTKPHEELHDLSLHHISQYAMQKTRAFDPCVGAAANVTMETCAGKIMCSLTSPGIHLHTIVPCVFHVRSNKYGLASLVSKPVLQQPDMLDAEVPREHYLPSNFFSFHWTFFKQLSPRCSALGF